jgi:hypothetical protein
MPLSDEEWTSGRKWDTDDALVLAHLKIQGKPVNQTEIVQGLRTKNPSTDFWGFIQIVAEFYTVGESLRRLIREGSVEARTIKQKFGEEVYYKAK